LTDYHRLPDAYDEGGNDDLRLKSGFAVGFGSGLNTKRVVCGKITIARVYKVRFTKLRAARQEDAVGRSAEEKTLMDDAFSIYDLLETTDHLGGVHVSSLYYETDEGLTFSEDGKHLIINAAISAEYFK
jgi:hypothetical protein